MRLLQLHAAFIEYEPIEEELDDAENDVSKSRIKLASLIRGSVSVEKGDNKLTVEKAIKEIRSYIENLKINKLLIYPYSHLSYDLAPPKYAFEIIKEIEIESRTRITAVYSPPL